LLIHSKINHCLSQVEAGKASVAAERELTAAIRQWEEAYTTVTAQLAEAQVGLFD
jgi:hypothetical protein